MRSVRMRLFWNTWGTPTRFNRMRHPGCRIGASEHYICATTCKNKVNEAGIISTLVQESWFWLLSLGVRTIANLIHFNERERGNFHLAKKFDWENRLFSWELTLAKLYRGLHIRLWTFFFVVTHKSVAFSSGWDILDWNGGSRVETH